MVLLRIENIQVQDKGRHFRHSSKSKKMFTNTVHKIPKLKFLYSSYKLVFMCLLCCVFCILSAQWHSDYLCFCKTTRMSLSGGSQVANLSSEVLKF